MNLKKGLVISIGIVLILTSSLSMYKLFDSTKENNQLTQKIASLEKENNKLITTNKSQKKDLDSVKNNLENSKKEVTKLKKEATTDKVVASENEQQSNIVPNTDYMTPEMQKEHDETMKQARAERETAEKAQEEKENEPQYATYEETSRSLYQFASDNGVTIDEIYQLNPGAKAEPGKTFRIK